MPHCAAFDTNFQSTGDKETEVSIHCFARDAKTKKQGENAVGRAQLPKDARPCSRPFGPDAFEDRPQLQQELTGVQVSSLSPALTTQIKEENNIKQEEDELQVSVLEFSAVIVKTEESSLLQRTEQRDTQGEDRAETHSETEGDTEHSSNADSDDDWRAPLSCSHTDTESDGDKSAPETRASVDNGDMTGTGEGAESRKHKCSVCKERLGSRYKLRVHRRGHRGEEFRCSVCKKVFAVKCSLQTHMRTHTGEKPFNCSVCKKVFAVSSNLKTHMRTHTGEKPFGCSVCKKTFARKAHLEIHMRTHREETIRMFSLSESVC